MQATPPQPYIPHSLRPTRPSNRSLIFLTLWLLNLVLIALPASFKAIAGDDFPIPDIVVALQMLYLLLPLTFLGLWFSLQTEIARSYIPAFSLDHWTNRTFLGTISGAFAGLVLGIGGYAFFSQYNGRPYDLSLTNPTIIIPSLLGLFVGFGMFGWLQVAPLHHAVPHAYLWILLMSVAWLPVLLTWFLYDTFLSLLAINIFPDLHNFSRFFALQVALLVPVLSAFALLLKLSQPRLSARPRLPLTTLAILFTPVLLLTFLLVGLVTAQFQRIERAWIAPGSPYLRIDPSGQIFTSPGPGDASTLSTNLFDISPESSLRAQISDTTILLTSTTDSTPILTISPTSEPDGYGAVLNIIRFNPTGTLLAAGTGQAYVYDSATSISEDHAVHIWSVPDGTPLYTLTEPHYTVQSLAWSPDGRYIAAAGGITSYDSRLDDTIIRIWRLDPTTPTSPATPPTLYTTLTGHNSPVQALAWTPDSTKLISRDLNGLTAIWRIK